MGYEATLTLEYMPEGDLRPDNMLVANDLTLRLMDFGASTFGGMPSLGAEATRYFLPRRDWKTTPFTDRFALGSCFYCILTGHAPYSDCSDEEADAKLAEKAWPADVYDLPIVKVIVQCWECQYADTRGIYTDLKTVYDAQPW